MLARLKTRALLFWTICDCKADLFAITETWLSADNAAVRADLCPDGYKFIDHPRLGRRGGGTGLVYRDSLGIKKADAGEKESFEFSEWTVTSSSSRNLRVVIIYHPPYSDEIESQPMFSSPSFRFILNPFFCLRNSY